MPDGNRVPNRFELLNPTLSAIRHYGGSASVSDIEIWVIKNLGLSDEAAHVAHGDGRKTVLSYQLSWARTYLKQYGLIDNSSRRGVWSLTSKGSNAYGVNPDEVIWVVHSRDLERGDSGSGVETGAEPSGTVGADHWRETLLETMRNMPLDAFGRLCQKLLRESDFLEVVVTGRSEDWGIHGEAISRVLDSTFATFWVALQTKRHSGSIRSEQVQAFRGKLEGIVKKGEKGLFITTGTFTPDAQQEAARPGAIPVVLVDGEALADKLKELHLGVKVIVRTVEDVSVDTDWLNAT